MLRSAMIGRGVSLPLVAIFISAALPATRAMAQGVPTADKNAPVVAKVEPPSWWVGLTQDVMLLVYGKNLVATHASCNLSDMVVSRTQASANGDYLFVWIKFGAGLKPGTAVCRITTPQGEASFEIPISGRKQILGRNQGLSLDDVIYLIMPDRFANGDPTNDESPEFPGAFDRANPRSRHGGDLLGIEQHLDYLKDLGVTTLWLTPIVKNGAAQDYHGYGAVDMYAVDPHLGTLQDYKQFVESAHKQHMKVLFDAVPNHVGPLHPWVQDPPLANWFHGTKQDHLHSHSPLTESFYGVRGKAEQEHDLFEALVDPHTPPSLRRNLTDGWFFGILPDLNTENPLVREYLIQNSIWWAEATGLDGYRVDTVPYVNRAFWEQWHAGLRRIYPRLSTVGEVFHPDPAVTSFFVGGHTGWDGIDTGLTTVFDFPLFFALRAVVQGDTPAGRLANVLRADSLYPHPEYLVPFFANHDVPRFASLPGATTAKEELAFGLVLTLRGIPEIYYGDEIGMQGAADPDNRRDFPGGWIDDKKNAFTQEGRTPEQQQLFEYVQVLLRIRREHDAFRGGKLWHLYSDDSSYVFVRESENERLVVAFHKAGTDRDLNVSLRDTIADRSADVAPLFGKARAEIAGHDLHLHLPAESLSIFELR